MRCEGCDRLAARPHCRTSCGHIECQNCSDLDTCSVKDCGSHGRTTLVPKLQSQVHNTLGEKEYEYQSWRNALRFATNPGRLQDEVRKLIQKETMDDKKEHYVIAFDLEATDNKPMICRITQIGAVGAKGDETFDTLVKADQAICEEASKITGITNEDLKNAPVCRVALLNFCQYIERVRKGRPVTLLTYNGHGYDYKLLYSEFKRAGLDPYLTLRRVGVTKLFDIFTWVKENVPNHNLIKNEIGAPSYKLVDVHESLCGFRYDGAHDALADCWATQRVAGCDMMKTRELNMSCIDNASCVPIRSSVLEWERKWDHKEREYRKKLDLDRKASKNKPVQTIMSMFASKSAPKRHITMEVKEEQDETKRDTKRMKVK